MPVDPMIQALAGRQTWYVVLRGVTLLGTDRVRGEVVDLADMAGTRINTLIDRRYLYQYPYGLQVPEADDDGRHMLPDAIISAGLSQEAS